MRIGEEQLNYRFLSLSKIRVLYDDFSRARVRKGCLFRVSLIEEVFLSFIQSFSFGNQSTDYSLYTRVSFSFDPCLLLLLNVWVFFCFEYVFSISCHFKA